MDTQKKIELTEAENNALTEEQLQQVAGGVDTLSGGENRIKEQEKTRKVRPVPIDP